MVIIFIVENKMMNIIEKSILLKVCIIIYVYIRQKKGVGEKLMGYLNISL